MAGRVVEWQPLLDACDTSLNGLIELYISSS